MAGSPRRVLWIAVLAATPMTALAGEASFVNWENPHVSPMHITPDGSRLLAVNTADNRLEVFDLTSGVPVRLGSVPVGLDPVSVRARTNTEVWVVNHISDSVSIVDLTALNVVATIPTRDEPTDVVFAGDPQRAFVSCSQVNSVLVFNPEDRSSEPVEVPIDGEDPRAMAVSMDGSEVYVAIFESGNRSTILGGGSLGLFGPNAVNDSRGPYGGVNPPPNDGGAFRPTQNPDNPSPPRVGLVVKKDAAGRWMDDNDSDWTDLVSGSNSNRSRRPAGWDLPDHDVAIIDAATLEVRYISGLMNICMAISVQPVSGWVIVVGTDATNEIRYEPILNGRFLRVNIAGADPVDPASPVVLDLNQHLVYTDDLPFEPIAQAERDKSLGDPRGIVWNPKATRAYITGMGSNNVAIINAGGVRQPPIGDPDSLSIEVGEGPTGLVLDDSRERLYVLNKFEASVSVIDLATEQVIETVSFFDPTPATIATGRKHLYDTHKTSGLGHTACGSCHVDARVDRLAWDLGNPEGEMKTFNQNCNAGLSGDCTDWHPMKGPMLSQTLQDIIGKEPHHWRGDKEGLEEFNGAFPGLLGDDAMLSRIEMQEFEDFLATIVFPPNPFRNFDNSLPNDLPLIGHFSTERFGPPGEPMPNGNAVSGLDLYRTGGVKGSTECVTCHTLPTGIGTNLTRQGNEFVPFPIGPNGGFHHSIIPGDGSTQLHFKIPQLRNLYDRVGFDTTQTANRAGFGFLHDGTVDSIVRFISLSAFDFADRQEVADVVAFMMSFSGSDLPMGSTQDPQELLGPTGNDTHAAVGTQITFDRKNREDPELIQRLSDTIALADDGAVGLVAKGRRGGLQRGYTYTGLDLFQSDRQSEVASASDLRLAAGAGSEITFTIVPLGSEVRIGIDRDEDGFFDRDELDACSDPADADRTPNNVEITGDHDGDGDVDGDDFAVFATCMTAPSIGADLECRCAFDFDRDTDIDLEDFSTMQSVFSPSP